MVGKDLIMATLFGSGGSSGSGGGGSAPAVSPKEVNFYDYDGTCVHAYTVAEAQALSELPAGPEHPGLVFQGWNWSLEGVKGLTRAMNIGAMYTTDDGTTRLYITLQEGRTSPMLGVGVNGTVTVDWGDGTEPDVLTGTSTSTTKWTPNHAYAAPGDYVIRLTVDGEMAFAGNNYVGQGAYVLRHKITGDIKNQAYKMVLKRVECGDGPVYFNARAFSDCRKLTHIVTSRGLKNIGETAFNACTSLESLVVPDGISSIGASALSQCISLRYVSIPDSVTSFADVFNSYSYALRSFTMPDGVNSYTGTLRSAYLLEKMDIPAGLTDVPQNMFNENYSLTSIIFRGPVQAINAYAFYNCQSLIYIDLTACTAVPTLSSSDVFGTSLGKPPDCEIRVPAALYDEWIAATNWATYADYIKAY